MWSFALSLPQAPPPCCAALSFCSDNIRVSWSHGDFCRVGIFSSIVIQQSNISLGITLDDMSFSFYQVGAGWIGKCKSWLGFGLSQFFFPFLFQNLSVHQKRVTGPSAHTFRLEYCRSNRYSRARNYSVGKLCFQEPFVLPVGRTWSVLFSSDSVASFPVAVYPQMSLASHIPVLAVSAEEWVGGRVDWKAGGACSRWTAGSFPSSLMSFFSF